MKDYFNIQIGNKWIECKKALPREANQEFVAYYLQTPETAANSEKNSSAGNRGGSGAGYDNLSESFLSSNKNFNQSHVPKFNKHQTSVPTQEIISNQRKPDNFEEVLNIKPRNMLNEFALEERGGSAIMNLSAPVINEFYNNSIQNNF